MSDTIKKFCEERNANILDRLERPYAVLFQREAVRALTEPTARHDIARQVLAHYGLDENGNPPDLKQRPRAKAEGLVNGLSVAMTGARPGDIIVGASKATKGAAMRIHSDSVPPQKRQLDTVRFYPDLWNRFIVKLAAVPFFASMRPVSREIWLQLNEADDENSIGQDGARLELLQPGAADLVTRLTETDLNLLMQENQNSEDGWWSYKEIENMIPRKAGSNARRHTLILLRSFWKLATDYKITKKCDDVCVKLSSGITSAGCQAGKDQEIFVLGSIASALHKSKGKWVRPVGSVQSVGIVAPLERLRLKSLDVDPAFERACSNFTGASYKSLLQKIIRFRPDRVDIGTKTLPAEEALRQTLRLLGRHPGAFIPDIQRYVTGIESMTKRVAVSIYEDSSLPLESAPSALLSLLTGSLLAQRVRTWSPSPSLFESWLTTAVTGWHMKSAVIIGRKSKEPYVVGAEQTDLQNASAILDELRSFPGDLELARGWAKDYPSLKMEQAQTTPQSMPLAHCVDQHWAPGLVHYFDPAFVVSTSTPDTAPFAGLFRTIWDDSSGVNPRRQELDWAGYEQGENVLQIRRAQRGFLTALQKDQQERTATGKEYRLKYTLENAWLAGLIGAMEVKIRGHPVMLVTLSTDDPTKLIAIRRPSRNMTEEPLTPEDEEAAITRAKERLACGVSMNKATAPAPELDDCVAVLKADREGYPRYLIRKGDREQLVEWDTVRHLNLTFPVLEPLEDWSIESALTRVSTGVEEGAEEKLVALMESVPIGIVRRAAVYLSTFNARIEMHRVSRDGGGTYKAVTLDDVGAYQFMLRLSSLYPAALSPALHKPSTFVVPVGPLLWTIRKKIVQFITVGEIGGAGWESVPFEDSERELWPHQREMVDDMVANRAAGDKGNFIWVPVGLGKTSAVFSYLQYLKEHNQLPAYIVYTLPESAIGSIIQEIKYFDIPINVIIPLKDITKKKGKYSGVRVSQSCEPRPYMVNLIEHDYLRRCEKTLLAYASRMFFVVDEVHKTLNDTRRTSVSLEIAHLSQDFIVLTGTPVIDNNTAKLIGWLEQVVPFEVNNKNFWVAASSMIAKTVNTGIKVDEKAVLALFTKDEEAEYMKLVPPALGGTNVSPFSWRLDGSDGDLLPSLWSSNGPNDQGPAAGR